MLTLQRIDPQAARGKLKESMWTDPDYLLDEKLDGIRQTGQFMEFDVRFTGRRESVKGGLTERSEQIPHLSSRGCPVEWRNGRIPILSGTALDGEICLDEEYTKIVRAKDPTGALSKEVQSILNSSPAESFQKQLERGWLRWVVFDCIMYKGRDLREVPLEERLKYMRQAVEEWGNKYVVPCPGTDVHKREFYENVLAAGGEGVILKHRRALYGQQTKWIKVKGTWTADVVITGYEAARETSVKKGDSAATATRYHLNGWIGGVVVSQYRDGQLVQVTSPGHGVSGMSDALREDLSRNGDSYLGRVLTIKHNGREAATGRFRHPRWGHLRDDKPAEDCVWDLSET